MKSLRMSKCSILKVYRRPKMKVRVCSGWGVFCDTRLETESGTDYDFDRSGSSSESEDNSSGFGMEYLF